MVGGSNLFFFFVNGIDLFVEALKVLGQVGELVFLVLESEFELADLGGTLLDGSRSSLLKLLFPLRLLCLCFREQALQLGNNGVSLLEVPLVVCLLSEQQSFQLCHLFGLHLWSGNWSCAYLRLVLERVCLCLEGIVFGSGEMQTGFELRGEQV